MTTKPPDGQQGAREFWLNEVSTGPNSNITQWVLVDLSPNCGFNNDNKIHVIEKSAYDSLKSVLLELKHYNKMLEAERDAVVAERDALKWPLSNVSKQYYRRYFNSVEECQDFYCGYIVKQEEENAALKAELAELSNAMGLSEYGLYSLSQVRECAKERDQLKAELEREKQEPLFSQRLVPQLCADIKKLKEVLVCAREALSFYKKHRHVQAHEALAKIEEVLK